MKNEHTRREINWHTKSFYVDTETGEQIAEQTAKKDYDIINKKIHKHVYRATGTITVTNVCRRAKYKQGSLF